MVKIIIKETLRWTTMAVCIGILAWIGWYFLIGFSEADIPEDYTPGEAIPYR